ncbi:unnamed protein product [Ilex paraguariensis]|uniref:N-acetyltransferase domain-containing protein n=1 Tax=Ilex paraguariensis TaxID=185542 RepID=A0ABC8SXV5_9AQUA
MEETHIKSDCEEAKEIQIKSDFEEQEEIQVNPDCEEADDEFSDITLRPFDRSDVDDFMVWAKDEKVSKFCTWEPHISKEETMNYIIDYVLPHPWYRAICLKNRPIGAITVRPNQGNYSCRAELGYVLAYNYWGKGVMTRAVKMAETAIFTEWPHLQRLEALVDVDNSGSQRVLEKAGFQREGVLRKYRIQKGKAIDMVMFSFLCTDSVAHYYMNRVGVPSHMTLLRFAAWENYLTTLVLEG